MPAKTAKPPVPSVQPKNRLQWRKWLEKNHASAPGVSLILVKKDATIPGVSYEEAVEEALCFGWIDSRGDRLDEQRFRQYMGPRKPGSVWAPSNKQRVKRLIKEGRMTPAGIKLIEAAKKDGSWSMYDDIERLIVPADLKRALNADARASRNFEAFSASARKMILFWIASAKREETRKKRITETVRQARRNIKAAPGPGET